MGLDWNHVRWILTEQPYWRYLKRLAKFEHKIVGDRKPFLPRVEHPGHSSPGVPHQFVELRQGLVLGRHHYAESGTEEITINSF